MERIVAKIYKDGKEVAEIDMGEAGQSPADPDGVMWYKFKPESGYHIGIGISRKKKSNEKFLKLGKTQLGPEINLMP